MNRLTALLAATCLLHCAAALAQEDAAPGAGGNAAATPATDAAERPAPGMDLAQVVELLQAQQQALEQQKAQLAAQQQTLQQQKAELAAQQALLAQQESTLDAQRRRMEAQDQKIATLTGELDTLRTPDGSLAGGDATTVPVEILDQPVASPGAQGPQQRPEKADEQADQTSEAVAQAQQDDPTRALLEDFKGAWRLPGTNAALGIGGYVKSAMVYNFDPLEIPDRFIVGSIPVSSTSVQDAEAQSSLTADQSRINFDLREPTEYGVLRAFIEGDFAEDNGTFRLRHAFGQWNKITAGKTWSAFVDTQASPEEVDFEGLNGRINVRQTQLRVMPTLGHEYEFQFSMEDPNPQVQNGRGVTRFPDLVMTGRFNPRERLHTKAALLLRQVRAQRPADEGAGVEKDHGWGLSLSGRYRTPQFNEQDSVLFQLSYGNVIGRYVNDLSSVGNFDGIFNPDNGELELFDIFAGYVSYQHWWDPDTWGLKWLTRNQMRSNFTLGFVDVDNPGFVSGDAYKRTIRLSGNLFWSPTPRIDIGGEYLWGSRENEDGSDGDAKQVQFAVRYRF